MSDIITPPPPKPLNLNGKSDLFKELLNYFTQNYQSSYYVWLRTGGYVNGVTLSEIVLNQVKNVSNTVTTMIESKISIEALRHNRYLEFECFGLFNNNSNNKSLFFSLENKETFNFTGNFSGSWKLNSKLFFDSKTNTLKIVSTLTSNETKVSVNILPFNFKDIIKNKRFINFSLLSQGIIDNDITLEVFLTRKK